MNIASDVIKVRDVYYINISAGSKIRKTTIKLESGIELFSVDLSNWDQKTYVLLQDILLKNILIKKNLIFY